MGDGLDFLAGGHLGDRRLAGDLDRLVRLAHMPGAGLDRVVATRAEQVRGAIAATAPALAKAVSEADGKIRSKAWCCRRRRSSYGVISACCCSSRHVWP